jgi:hypothetical protein
MSPLNTTDFNNQQESNDVQNQHTDTAATLQTLERAGIRNVDPKQLNTPEGRTDIANSIDETRLSLLKPDIIRELSQEQARQQLKEMGLVLRARLNYLHSAAGHQMMMSALGLTLIPLVGSVASHIQGRRENKDYKALMEDLRRFMLLASKAGVPIDQLEDKEITIREPGGKLLTTIFCLPARIIRRMQTRHDAKEADAIVADVIKEIDMIALSANDVPMSRNRDSGASFETSRISAT